MVKNLDSYGETLFNLINFRGRIFTESRKMIGIDYDSFMILSCIGAHYLKNNTAQGLNWDSVWELTRSKKVNFHYNAKKLTIFAIANIMNIPKETVRRKIEVLKKKKFISHSSRDGLVPTDKVEELMKPFALRELKLLSKFLQALKKHKALDQLLSF